MKGKSTRDVTLFLDSSSLSLRNQHTKLLENEPGRYQRLDLFIKVLSLLCPNLTDTSQANNDRGYILPTFPLLGFLCWDVTARHRK